MSEQHGWDVATAFRELTDGEKALVEERTRKAVAEADDFYARRPRRFGDKAALRKARAASSSGR